MAKKLSDIRHKVKENESSFNQYLYSIVPKEAIEFMENAANVTDLYIFSGVIRNFFLGIDEARDLDFVVEDVSKITRIINKYQFRKNSFGGYKIVINDLNIDLWEVKDTWAFEYQNQINYQLYKAIPNTSFFNFSSIIYHFNKKKFIFNDDFLRFLRDKCLDISYSPNPNYELCLINTLYYSEKYELRVSSKLKKFIKDYYYQIDSNFPDIQRKHFGKVLFSTEEIKNKIELVLQTDKAYKDD